MNEKDNEQDYKAEAKKLMVELITKKVEAATKELPINPKELVSKLANEMSELCGKAFEQGCDEVTSKVHKLISNELD